MRDARVIHGYRSRAAITIRVLDALSRRRALTDAESDRLYQAIRDERRYLNMGLSISGHEADRSKSRVEVGR